MPFVNKDNLTRFYTKLKDKMYLKTEVADLLLNQDTVVSKGTNYGEVCTWNDGNPSSEDRLYRFVTIVGDNREIGIANSTSQIVGTSNLMENVGFLGNYTPNAESDTSKVIVSILGCSYVKTNDNTIVANDRVMSDDNGYAIKSSNNLGYRVLKVVSSGLLEIVVSPNTDMVQRIRTDVAELQNNMVTHTHDNRYYTESEIDTKVSELNTAIANSGKFYGIDTSNILTSQDGNVGNGGRSYTATEDCYVFVYNNYGDNVGSIYINGVYAMALHQSTCSLVLKNGQTITVYHGDSGYQIIKLRAFGIKG